MNLGKNFNNFNLRLKYIKERKEGIVSYLRYQDPIYEKSIIGEPVKLNQDPKALFYEIYESAIYYVPRRDLCEKEKIPVVSEVVLDEDSDKLSVNKEILKQPDIIMKSDFPFVLYFLSKAKKVAKQVMNSLEKLSYEKLKLLLKNCNPNNPCLLNEFKDIVPYLRLLRSIFGDESIQNILNKIEKINNEIQAFCPDIIKNMRFFNRMIVINSIRNDVRSSMDIVKKTIGHTHILVNKDNGLIHVFPSSTDLINAHKSSTNVIVTPIDEEVMEKPKPEVVEEFVHRILEEPEEKVIGTRTERAGERIVFHPIVLS